MAENNLSNTSIEENKCKELKIDILSNTSIEEYKYKRLKIESKERLQPASECCIYRVPTNLRTTCPKAYTPQFISIGPLHHGNKELSEMEKQKIRFKNDFVKRMKEEWKVLITHIQKNEQRIRDCYAETSKLQSHEFIIMIFFDAIFIIELFLKKQEKNSDFLLVNPCFNSGICLDLQLIENQLPFFILTELYELASRNLTNSLVRPPEDPFVKLSCNFFEDYWYEEVNGEKFLHFVDWRRNLLVKKRPNSRHHGSNDFPSAIKLHESGMKFTEKKVIGTHGLYQKDRSLLNIEFDQKGCRPFFKVHELQIPPITIQDDTEYLFRNMMALEQCHYPFDTHICNYIDFMDYLIDTEKDVDLLVEKNIITNYVGEHAAIAKMFNRLCLQITPSESCYKDIGKHLKDHHKNPWNQTKAILMSVYFSNLWRGTGTFAAFILLVLTLLQTVFTIGAWR